MAEILRHPGAGDAHTATSLPQNVEAEAALLGALMIDNRLVEDVQLRLKPHHFFEPLHGRMSILSDRWIREQAMTNGMIEPFVEAQRRDGCISYGLSSYGYDARVADEFKIFTNVDSAIVDPKDFAANSFVDRKTDVCIIPPNSFALARTVEYFRVPRDVLVICLGKSTYARCGIIVNVTPLEPGWEGHVTLEFSNTTPLPAKIYANEGACQFLFLAGNEPCETSYADRAGKYMGQRGVTLPKL